MEIQQDSYEEKRSRLRASFKADVIITTHTGKRINGILQNISITGVYIETESFPPVGSNCNIDIILIGRNSSLKLSVSGSVARTDDSGIGVQFNSDLEWWSLFPIFASFMSDSKKN